MARLAGHVIEIHTHGLSEQARGALITPAINLEC